MNAEQPPGPPVYVRMPAHMRQFKMVNGEKVEIVHRMRKVLYGQHVAGRQFSEMHRKWFKDNGFESSHAEPCLFVCNHELGKCIVAMYVDDCCWVFENSEVEKHFSDRYKASFKADLAECSRFLKSVCVEWRRGNKQDNS